MTQAGPETIGEQNGPEIRYIGDDAFSVVCSANYQPPKAQFYDLLNDLDKDRSVLLWLECLFFRHGMITRETMSKTVFYAGEELLEHFVCDGVPGLLLFDLRMDEIEFFSVKKRYKKRRDPVAETIRDLIRNEGRSVTYDDLTTARRALFPPSDPVE